MHTEASTLKEAHGQETSLQDVHYGKGLNTCHHDFCSRLKLPNTLTRKRTYKYGPQLCNLLCPSIPQRFGFMGFGTEGSAFKALDVGDYSAIEMEG